MYIGRNPKDVIEPIGHRVLFDQVHRLQLHICNRLVTGACDLVYPNVPVMQMIVIPTKSENMASERPLFQRIPL
jgi:hypothetical protein